MKFRKNNSKLIVKVYYVEFLLDQQYAYIKYKEKMHFFDKESQKIFFYKEILNEKYINYWWSRLHW